MTRTALIIAILGLTACVPAPDALQSYAPVVDLRGHSQASYDRSLAECRALATSAQASYQKQQNDQLAASLILGALIGAAVGSTYDSSAAGYGAAYGAAAGVASVDTELATGGPRRIVDRCMDQRGFAVLSDLGAGQ